MRLCVYVVFTVYAHSVISLVQPVNPKSETHAQKCYTSEPRPSFCGWRGCQGWQARLPDPLSCLHFHIAQEANDVIM